MAYAWLVTMHEDRECLAYILKRVLKMNAPSGSPVVGAILWMKSDISRYVSHRRISRRTLYGVDNEEWAEISLRVRGRWRDARERDVSAYRRQPGVPSSPYHAFMPFARGLLSV